MQYYASHGNYRSLFRCNSAAKVEKKPEEKKKSPSPQKEGAPEFIEKFPDTVRALLTAFAYLKLVNPAV